MKIIDFSRNVLFLLLVIYFSQGVIYPVGGIVAKIVLLFLFLYCLFYMVKLLLIKTYKPAIFWIWTIFILLNAGGFILTFNYNDARISGMIRSILITLLPFYPFYYFSLKNQLSSEHLRRYFLIMLPIVVAQYYVTQNQLVSLTDQLDVVNNSSYILVYFLPFIFILKNRFIEITSLSILMYLIVDSAKRSAIIVGVIFTIFFIFFLLQTMEKRKRFYGFLLITLITIGLADYLINIIASNEFLLDRMNSLLEGDSSGRDRILTQLYEAWVNSGFMNLLFGFGFASSLTITNGQVAHNDWAELLVNFGLFGIFIFLVIYVLFFKYVFYKNWNTGKRILILSLITICILMGLTSRWYSSMHGYTISILAAYLVGSKERDLV